MTFGDFPYAVRFTPRAVTDGRSRTRDRWLTPGVRGIGAASLLSDLGHEIPTALLPSLLTSTLGAPAAALGVIEGVSDGLAGAARFAGGALADDPQRRRAAAVGGYATTAVLSGLIGAATSVWQVGVLRAGVVGRARPARAGRATRCSPTSWRPPPTGAPTASSARWTTSAPSAGRCSRSRSSPRSTCARRSRCRSSPACSRSRRSSTRSASTPRPSRAERQPLRIRVKPVLQGSLGRLMVGVGAFEIGNIAATLLILRATELLEPGHGQDDAVQLALLLYAGYNLAATLASVPAGRMADRRGPPVVLLGGVACFLLAYLGFAATGASIALLAACFVAAGVAIGCVETAEHAAVAGLAPEDLRGSAFGLLAAVQSFGNLVASAVAGLLWTLVSPAAGMLFAAAMMAIALACLTRVRSRSADQSS